MRVPVKGLRPIRQGGAAPIRVEVIVAPGDVLEVSEDVAGQLMASSQQFKAEAAPVPVVEVEDAEPVKRRGRKAADV